MSVLFQGEGAMHSNPFGPLIFFQCCIINVTSFMYAGQLLLKN